MPYHFVRTVGWNQTGRKNSGRGSDAAEPTAPTGFGKQETVQKIRGLGENL